MKEEKGGDGPDAGPDSAARSVRSGGRELWLCPKHGRPQAHVFSPEVTLPLIRRTPPAGHGLPSSPQRFVFPRSSHELFFGVLVYVGQTVQGDCGKVWREPGAVSHTKRVGRTVLLE